MSESVVLVRRLWEHNVVRQMVFAIAVTIVLFAFSHSAPEYIKVAAKENLTGLVVILYALWLSLIVLWFKAWQWLFHSSTSSQ